MQDQFIKWAETHNWNIMTCSEKTELPEDIQKRYRIPEQWYSFICRMKKCEDQTGTKWFLTPFDFMPHSEDFEGFRWNEFEALSLEWVGQDSSIIAFWDRHIPIFMSVDGSYSYYAIDTETGNVVEGFEPEFEEAEVVADDFQMFISKVISGEIQL